MEPEQRKTIKSFFLPDPKKTRHEQRQDLDQSPSSPNICSDSSPSIDITFDTTSVTANSGNKSMPVDISRTCNDLPSQPKLGSYPSNSRNRSFQANWYVNRPWLEYSMSNDRVYCFNCRHFRSYKTNIGDAFTSCGYNNWIEDSSSNATYLSHDIQNELLKIIANQIRERVSHMVTIVHYTTMYFDSENRILILVK